MELLPRVLLVVVFAWAALLCTCWSNADVHVRRRKWEIFISTATIKDSDYPKTASAVLTSIRRRIKAVDALKRSAYKTFVPRHVVQGCQKMPESLFFFEEEEVLKQLPFTDFVSLYKIPGTASKVDTWMKYHDQNLDRMILPAEIPAFYDVVGKIPTGDFDATEKDALINTASGMIDHVMHTKDGVEQTACVLYDDFDDILMTVENDSKNYGENLSITQTHNQYLASAIEGCDRMNVFHDDIFETVVGDSDDPTKDVEDGPVTFAIGEDIGPIGKDQLVNVVESEFPEINEDREDQVLASATELRTLSERCTSLEEQVRSLNETAATLRYERNEVVRDLQDTKVSLAAMIAKNRDLEHSLDRANSGLDQYVSENETFRNEQKRLGGNILSLEERLAMADALVQTVGSEKTRLVSEIKTVLLENDVTRRENSHLIVEVDSMRCLLRETTEQLQRLQALVIAQQSGPRVFPSAVSSLLIPSTDLALTDTIPTSNDAGATVAKEAYDTKKYTAVFRLLHRVVDVEAVSLRGVLASLTPTSSPSLYAKGQILMDRLHEVATVDTDPDVTVAAVEESVIFRIDVAQMQTADSADLVAISATSTCSDSHFDSVGGKASSISVKNDVLTMSEEVESKASQILVISETETVNDLPLSTTTMSASASGVDEASAAGAFFGLLLGGPVVGVASAAVTHYVISNKRNGFADLLRSIGSALRECLEFMSAVDRKFEFSSSVANATLSALMGGGGVSQTTLLPSEPSTNYVDIFEEVSVEKDSRSVEAMRETITHAVAAFRSFRSEVRDDVFDVMDKATELGDSLLRILDKLNTQYSMFSSLASFVRTEFMKGVRPQVRHIGVKLESHETSAPYV